MRYDAFLFAILAAPLAVSMSRPVPVPPTGLTLDCTVVRCIDGDTIEVEVRRTFHVRLMDCWAPESRTKDQAEKKLGKAAAANLESIIPAGSPAVVHIPASDRGQIGDMTTMSRVVGRVWPKDGDSRDLSQRQVDTGHATKDRPGK